MNGRRAASSAVRPRRQKYRGATRRGPARSARSARRPDYGLRHLRLTVLHLHVRAVVRDTSTRPFVTLTFTSSPAARSWRNTSRRGHRIGHRLRVRDQRPSPALSPSCALTDSCSFPWLSVGLLEPHGGIRR